MKKLLTLCIAITLLCAVGCSESGYDDSLLRNELTDLANRVAKLEQLCQQMNTNISSLQTIVNALQQNDFITAVVPVTQGGKVIGYTITFSRSGAITIYHGNDGSTPQISVKQESDGIYYWTLNGEWLLDASGNKIQANGVNGTNGINGITPKLKIENEYWYISYDNGATWEQLGKATGNDGINGDNLFTSVTQDDDYVYFNLADGTTITLPKHDKENIQFEDLYVKAICCKNWDTNNDGELSYAEAAAIETIGEVFNSNSNIVAFTELKHFTSLTEISTSAFKNCVNLWKITFPNNITKVGNYAFENCSSLCEIIISGNVASINDCAFMNCTQLRKVKIHDGVSSLGWGVFKGCSNLTEISLPNSIIEIGSCGFSDCTNLESITLPENIIELSSSMFWECEHLSKIAIPNKVIRIDDSAFYGCVNLASIVIPPHVKFIERNAFIECPKLMHIYCQPETPPAIYYFRSSKVSEGQYGAFPKNYGMKIYVPIDSYESYTSCSCYNYNVNSTSVDNWEHYKSYVVPFDFESL